MIGRHGQRLVNAPRRSEPRGPLIPTRFETDTLEKTRKSSFFEKKDCFLSCQRVSLNQGWYKGPLFRTIGRGTQILTRTPLPQANAYAMVRRRALAAAIGTKIGNHSFRATGTIAYL